MAMSMYKCFGYPTGVGALVIKKSLMGRMRKSYFAGGTVKFVSVPGPGYETETGYARFEVSEAPQYHFFKRVRADSGMTGWNAEFS